MPEGLGNDELSFSKRLYDIKETYPDVLKKVSEKEGLKYIGSGAECAVIATKTGEYRVTAFRYHDMDPNKAKSVYYLQRVLSTLFPHNFPQFFSSFAQNTEKGIHAGTIREKIKKPLVRYETIGNESLRKKYDSSIRYPFNTVEKTLQELEISVSFDLFEGNLGVGPDGGEYYLDTPMAGYGYWNPEKIKTYMTTHKNQEGRSYSPYEIRVVDKCVQRLHQLGFAHFKQQPVEAITPQS